MTQEYPKYPIISQEKALENLIYNTVKRVLKEERREIEEEYKLYLEAKEGKCNAHGMFNTENKVEDYYNTRSLVRNHIDLHKRRESIIKVLIAFSSGSVALSLYTLIKEYLKRVISHGP